MKKCILPGREGQICSDCGECDDRCQLDPAKICDNCFKCLDLPDQEYASIPVSGVYLDGEFFDDAAGEKRAAGIHLRTLYGCRGRCKKRR